MRNTFYSTTNKYYTPAWDFDQINNKQKDLSKTQDIRKAKVPTFAEIGANMVLQKRHVMSLRNQLVAKKFGAGNDMDADLDEFSKLRLKYNRNAIRAKPFPVKPGEYKYPQRGLDKEPNPLYETNYMNYGKLHPSKFEIPNKFHPKDNKYTSEFIGGMFKYEGLNTAYSYSNVHDTLNGDL